VQRPGRARAAIQCVPPSKVGSPSQHDSMQGRAASEVKHRRRRSTETKAKRATRDANASAIMAAMAEAARLAAAKARAGVGSPQPTAEPRAPCGDGSAWELSRIAAGANLSCSSTSSSRLWQRQLRTRDGPQHPAAGRTRLHADWRGNRSVAGCGTPSGGGTHAALPRRRTLCVDVYSAQSWRRKKVLLGRDTTGPLHDCVADKRCRIALSQIGQAKPGTQSSRFASNAKENWTQR